MELDLSLQTIVACDCLTDSVYVYDYNMSLSTNLS